MRGRPPHPGPVAGIHHPWALSAKCAGSCAQGPTLGGGASHQPLPVLTPAWFWSSPGPVKQDALNSSLRTGLALMCWGSVVIAQRAPGPRVRTGVESTLGMAYSVPPDPDTVTPALTFPPGKATQGPGGHCLGGLRAGRRRSCGLKCCPGAVMTPATLAPLSGRAGKTDGPGGTAAPSLDWTLGHTCPMEEPQMTVKGHLISSPCAEDSPGKPPNAGKRLLWSILSAEGQGACRSLRAVSSGPEPQLRHLQVRIKGSQRNPGVLILNL